MNGLPYFRWYPTDAYTDEKYAAMSLAELGLYHLCLNLAWVNNGIPADLGRLAAILKLKREEIERLWKAVGKCFTEVDGRLYNQRQEKERKHALTKSEKATKSVRMRYERSSNDHIRAYDSDSSLEILKEKLKTEHELKLVDSFTEFMKAWMRKDASGREFPAKDVDLACQQWMMLVDRKLITGNNLHEVFAGLERARASQQWRNPQFVPSMAVWLGWCKNGTPNAPKWNDYPAPAQPESEY